MSDDVRFTDEALDPAELDAYYEFLAERQAEQDPDDDADDDLLYVRHAWSARRRDYALINDLPDIATYRAA